MAENNISLPLKGMNTDLHSLNLDQNAYTFALNAITGDFFTGQEFLLGNEPSNRCSINFPPNYQVVGFVQIIEQNRTIYFLKNSLTGNCQIGEVLNCKFTDITDNIEKVYCKDCPEYTASERLPLEKRGKYCYCDYNLIIEAECLNFDVNYPVDIEYKLTNCSLNLYFTDAINERRFIYFDYLDNDFSKSLIVEDDFKLQIGVTGDCNVPVYADTLDCEKIKFHPNYNTPCIEFEGFISGGNLKAGTYQVLVAYSDAYGTALSSYFPSTQVMPLFSEQITFETNYQTDKAIKFNINNLVNNSVFKYHNIVIAQTIDSFTEFIFVGTFDNNQTTYTYTGYEKALKRLDPTEVFFKRPYYKTARGVTKANNYLFFTGLEEYPILNFQPIVNQITLQWQTVALKENAYYDPRNTFYFKTYQRDEVYSFGIIFIYNNGRESCVHHIPGRTAVSNDLTPITDTTDIIQDDYCSEGVTTLPKWKVYNTGSVLGGEYEYNEECEITKCWEFGDMAYWESTETYPNIPEVWGNLCNQPIRHHKFPDSCITHIHNGFGAKKTYKDNNYIFPIGIRVDHESIIAALDNSVTDGIITQEQRNTIVGYRIVRGNRVAQKSVIAKGLLFNMFSYEKGGNTYYFPNYSYNDLNTDPFLNDVSLAPSNRFTFHSPDTHFVNPSLGSVLKLETEEYGESEGYFTHSECQAKYKFLNTFAYTLAFGLGIAAALSATGEKICKTITYTNDVKTQPFTTSTSGSTPVGIVTGSSPGATTTTIANSAFNANTDVPLVTEVHNTAPYDTYNPTTGAIISNGSGNAADEQITTCKGQPFQIFNSDTFIGSLFLGLNNIIQRTILGLIEMQKVMDTLRLLIPHKNLSIQYNSIGKYNNYDCVPVGKKITHIDKSAYLKPYIQNVDEPSANPASLFETVKINNWNRESSVYLKTEITLNNPSKDDFSKCTMSDESLGTGDLDKLIYKDIASFYGSIKNPILNQYGKLCDIEYLETTSCAFNLAIDYSNCELGVFGGDTFISRFGLKRKMPFFTHTMCKLPDDSDVLYSELGNAGTPKFYFNTPQPLGERISSLSDFASILSLITSENDKSYDVNTNHLFHQDGFIHLFNYGIPYFLVESDINLNYRHGQNNKEKDFYPHTTDLKRWMEEEFVPISEDNYYFYNRTYSKQNKEATLCTSCLTSTADLICQSNNYNRLIYSEPSNNENNDNWLLFKANSYWDFPLSLGKLITADGIEDDKVLVRLEKGTQIFNAYNTIQSTGADIQVGTGGLFQSRPKDIAITELGYAGSQHRSIIHTEYGHIWADAERGQVFNLGNGGESMNEISKDGMKSFFKENLKFQIKKDFPSITNYDIDNNLNGIGLHFCFDKRFNRLLLTKLDYKKVNPAVQFDSSTKTFFVLDETQTPVKVELWNPKYFCSKGWTISYNFYLKTWTSFHSYIPEFYIQNQDTFDSSHRFFGQQSIYTHNASNKSYQVFYDKLQPFIVEVLSKPTVNSNYLNDIHYKLDVIRYHNEFDTYFNQKITFNKAIVFNNNQTSGLLTFKISNPEDLTEVEYPKRIATGYEILTTNSENIWNFNDFFDVSIGNNIPIFMYDCNNVNKSLNTKAINYDKPDFDRSLIRQGNCRVRLINDHYSNYKFIFNVAEFNQSSSIR